MIVRRSLSRCETSAVLRPLDLTAKGYLRSFGGPWRRWWCYPGRYQ